MAAASSRHWRRNSAPASSDRPWSTASYAELTARVRDREFSGRRLEIRCGDASAIQTRRGSPRAIQGGARCKISSY
jgi:hypothetical protein